MKRNEGKGCSFVSLPSRNTFMCGAVSVNSWLIDANGDLYKCWDDVGDLSETIGNLREIDSAQLYSNPNLIKWVLPTSSHNSIIICNRAFCFYRHFVSFHCRISFTNFQYFQQFPGGF